MERAKAFRFKKEFATDQIGIIKSANCPPRLDN